MALAVGSTPRSPAVLPPGLGRLLIVDDEPYIRDITARLLRRRGIDVLEARSGFEALQRLGEHADVRLLLLDWQMPGLAGAELLHTVRQHWPHLPIVLTSGDLPELELDEHTGFLSKPFRYDLLHRVVAAALGDEGLPAFVKR